MRRLAKKKLPMLSKSRYVAGLQCHLRLWNETYEREHAAPVDASLQAIFDTGNEVGIVATQAHPGGVMIETDHRRHEEAVERTLDAMRDKKTSAIFEAGFCHEGVRIRVDILERLRGGAWALREVKSTGSCKEHHLDDVAVQYWVLKGCGLRVKEAGVVTLNTAYVYQGGAYDMDALFDFTDLTADVKAQASQVAETVAELHGMLRRKKAPQVEVGPQCTEPYECGFYQHCTRDYVWPDHPITNLPRLSRSKREQLEDDDLESIDEIPSEFPLTELQRRVRDAVMTGDEYVAHGLGPALAEPLYPIHHLDFETFNPALPRYPQTRPYQVLPFQWSNHIQQDDGRLEHQEYLCREDKDPREEFAESLLKSLGTKGSICIYTGYEIRIIRELADALPSLRRRLLALERRCWDLHAIIRDNYYHPDFHGSFSLKRVLPVLVPEMSYDDLDVADGVAAQVAYTQALRTTDRAERDALHEALVAYCAQDTLALVKVRRALARRVG